jgi:hypothetical protein
MLVLHYQNAGQNYRINAAHKSFITVQEKLNNSKITIRNENYIYMGLKRKVNLGTAWYYSV